jgi:HTH-type transcriptional regulator, sugar sensing transcriptional regulator
MDSIVFKLTQFGFSMYEAKAYLALLQKHPIIGYEVSKIAKIPTAKIYETLTNLKNKGIVFSSSSDPVLYYPLDPDMLLTRIQSGFNEKIKDLDELLERIPPIPNQVDITWNLIGYETVIEKILQVIQGASDELLVSLWPQEARAVQEQLVEAEKKGVHVIAGVFGPYDPGCTHIVNLESCGKTSQRRIQRRLNVVIADSNMVVISETGDETETLGIWTTTPCIVLIAKEYVKHDIWGKVLIDELGIERFNELCETNEIVSYLIQNK